MSFEDPFKPDDLHRSVSTFLPRTMSLAPDAQPTAVLAASTPVGSPYRPSAADSFGLYFAVLFLLVSLSAIGLYLLASVWSYYAAKRLRAPPPALTNDVLRAAQIFNIRSEEGGAPAPPLLPDYGAITAAARRALAVNSRAPAHYTNYNRHAAAGDPVGTLINDTQLSLAPEDVPGALDGSFAPAKVIYDEVREKQGRQRNVLFGFFHPYANAGGGGERVLWAAVKATLDAGPQNVCIVYTGLDTSSAAPEPGRDQDPSSPTTPPPPPPPDNSPAAILATALRRFGLEIDSARVVFIYIPRRHLVDPKTFPRFTLLGQALGSVLLAREAVTRLVPDVFVDTMGYPFVYPYVSLLTAAPIAAYVHYPVISNDMIDAMVANTNHLGGKKGQAAVALTKKQEAAAATFRAAKYLYWHAFALAYTFVGSYVSVVMANSSWTLAHMRKQWWWGHTAPTEASSSSTGAASKLLGSRIKVVYPPCATQDLDGAPIHSPRSNTIVYVAQFRPEKRHELVLREFARFLAAFKADAAAARARGEAAVAPLASRLASLSPAPKLLLVGTIRNDEDRLAVYNLRLLARALGLADAADYEFILDAPWATVTEILATASIGINAMWNEHFGMVVVEYMAAGLVPVVHNSGGPKLDIVVPFAGTEAAPDRGNVLPTGLLFRAPQDPAEERRAVAVATLEDTAPLDTLDVDPAALNDPAAQTLADCLYTAYTLPQDVQVGFRERARASAKRFSDAAFARHWAARVDLLHKLEKRRRHQRIARGLLY